MRLPSYSHLLALPAGPHLLLRLLETIVVAACSMATQRLCGNSTAAGYDSAVAAFAIVFAWSLLSGSYLRRPARRPSAWRAVFLPALGWVLCEAGAVGIVKWMNPEYAPSMDRLACLGALTAASVIVCRVVDRIAGARRPGLASVAVVGCGERCAAFVRRITAMRDPACSVRALFDVHPHSGAKAAGVPLFHDIETFAAHVRTHRIDELWLALPLSDEETLLRFLDVFRDDLLNIRFLPDVRHVARFHGERVDLDGALAIDLVAAPLTAHAVSKALFDFVFAACAVVASAPLLIAIALAVKLSSPGPVLFRQRRQGANGQPFEIYKFRTMHVHANDDGTLVQATRNDPRITRIGAFLRRTSLDELPQFFNVLRGDMSVVGPRPHAIEHDALYQHLVDDYVHRYRIKPGITGWAQINGLRGETDSVEKMQRRVEHDLYYLSNWSFALDMRIVLLTIVRGFVHRNAY
ncbi:undecaprenyl-phosphate glucose phosphotransferase [Caballeronia ptereochthonis]|uniref:Sugar transferase n=1 Tax=Caballeronia ptereochthonis TaxID=1777144 RepID=A0A158BS27_9BURK|nr:undecaprenyl-phosphate glucose phosphotransferase [Caballeronia ptereochthonis]SAK72780.1 sugar transferase [Caballeronia ptereochthonis]